MISHVSFANRPERNVDPVLHAWRQVLHGPEGHPLRLLPDRRSPEWPLLLEARRRVLAVHEGHSVEELRLHVWVCSADEPANPCHRRVTDLRKKRCKPDFPLSIAWKVFPLDELVVVSLLTSELTTLNTAVSWEFWTVDTKTYFSLILLWGKLFKPNFSLQLCCNFCSDGVQTLRRARP